MGHIPHRRPANARAAMGRLQTQDMGEEQSVAGVHGYVEHVGLRGSHGSDWGGTSEP